MKNKILRLVAKITTFATIMSSVMTFSPVSAASFTGSKDTMTRLAISTTADHIIIFLLPTGVDFDSTTNTDILRADFPSSFSQSGTWVTGDFTFNDGTSRTVEAVAQGGGIVDCTVAAGANNVCVAIDTTNHIFTIKPSSTYTASATGATVTFQIFGTSPNGTLTNPSSAGSATLSYAQCDETASCTSGFTSTHTSSVGLGIADSDQVSVTATVDPSLTFDLDTATSGATENAAPYSVALGTITTTDGRVSGTTDSVNMITVEADTNAASGVIVTVMNANGASGLVSTSTPADTINSADATQANGTENYGLCVATAGLTGFTVAGGYSGDTCALNSETNTVEGLSATAQDILSTTGPVAGAHAEVVVNAAISGVTAAHTDYTDTLTFIATGTF